MPDIKIRKPKSDDQEKAEKAYSLIHELVQTNPGMDSTIWAAGCWTALINCYKDSGFDYEDFCKEVELVKQFYKDKFENEN